MDIRIGGRHRVVTYALGALVGGTLTMSVGGPVGLVLGVAATLVTGEWLHRAPVPAARRTRQRMARDLPLAANLLASSLRAGAPAARAASAVGEQLGGPVGERLVRVGRGLRLGSTAAEAWQQLADVPGGKRLVAVAVRSAEHGLGLANSLDRMADDLRLARESAAEAAARRAGVLVMLPLGLCFLPAFLLTAVVPIVASALGDLLSTT